MTDGLYFDQLETRSAEAREGALMARLPGLVAHAVANAPGWAKRLSGIDPRSICS
ncbi:MAG: phenylacetate--CoA ligase family protein, partial [Gemmatimonadales bacterium]|nr:phenylacetate--CoA ligase family protein [Gemmatimonadales bacterium]